MAPAQCGATVAREMPPHAPSPTGVYLTNESFLYRIAGFVAAGDEEPEDVVELEDCYGLDVVRVPVRELRERRLRIVIPAP
jgi:hypothetical protein